MDCAAVRGAWYAVVNDSKPTIVFLDVHRRNVAMDRTLLDLRAEAPSMWSVVRRSEEEPESRRRESWVDLNLTYGVCPQCRSRSNLTEGSTSAACGQCGGNFAIDWAHPC